MRLSHHSETRFPKRGPAHQGGWRVAPVAVLTLLAAWSVAVDAARVERSGAEVVSSVCAAACHGSGENGAPRIGDEKAWAQRAAQGLSALTAHALQGIRNMPAHGGNAGLSDIEIERAVVHMVNRSGERWVAPLDGTTPAIVRRGEAITQAHCAQCHRDGVEGAPTIGDRAAWAPRMRVGLDALVRSAVNGHGGMPPRGGVADLTDLELRGAIVHMFNFGIAMPKAPPPSAGKAADPFHRTIEGVEVYLGVMRAAAMPTGSTMRAAPRGKDVHHVNLSLIDARTGHAVADATVELRVADLLGSESRTLEPLSVNKTVSYGAYFSMPGPHPYTLTARIRRPDRAGEAEVTFEYRPR